MTYAFTLQETYLARLKWMPQSLKDFKSRKFHVIRVIFKFVPCIFFHPARLFPFDEFLYNAEEYTRDVLKRSREEEKKCIEIYFILRLYFFKL